MRRDQHWPGQRRRPFRAWHMRPDLDGAQRETCELAIEPHWIKEAAVGDEHAPLSSSRYEADDKASTSHLLTNLGVWPEKGHLQKVCCVEVLVGDPGFHSSSGHLSVRPRLTASSKGHSGSRIAYSGMALRSESHQEPFALVETIRIDSTLETE